MNDEQLDDYVSRSKDLIQESPQMDEANTKVRLIQPLIALLGWDPHSSEVELEYPVQMGAGTKKVDYALMLEETPVVFVETKGCDTTLSDSHRDQLKSYMRIVGVDWGVLTNGKNFEVLKRRPNVNRPEEILLGEFPLTELQNKSHLLNALSKESIETGESENIAENIERIRNAISTLQTNKDRIADSVVSVVTDELGESIPVKIENDAKAFVDQLVSSLQSHGPAVDDIDQVVDAEDSASMGEFWDRVENEIGMRRVDDDLELNSDINAVDNFIAFVEFLFDNGYISDRDIPYNPGGPKRYLLNSSPEHIDGSDMYNPHEVVEGVFLETHNSTADKKRYMKKMANEFANA